MPEPIKDIKMCPYCGKWSDAQTGFPFLFQSHRMRYHAHSNCQAKFTALHGMFAAPPYGPKEEQLRHIYAPPEPEPNRMSTDPSPQDHQINPNPTVDRMSQGKFSVRDIVNQPWAGPDWDHTLSADCSYCHKTIEIYLRAPLNVGKFAKDEACRVAILAHLRTEHPTIKKKQE